METSTLGKWIILVGLGIALIGGVIWLVGKTGLPLGRLPGDIRIERTGFRLYLPLTTCLLVSLVLTSFLRLLRR